MDAADEPTHDEPSDPAPEPEGWSADEHWEDVDPGEADRDGEDVDPADPADPAEPADGDEGDDAAPGADADAAGASRGAAAPAAAARGEAAAEPGGAPPADEPAAEAGADEGTGPGRRARRSARKRPRRPLPRGFEPPPLAAPLAAEARAAALERLAHATRIRRETLAATLGEIDAGRSIAFLARFRRGLTGGLDERRLKQLRDEWRYVHREEERRIQMRELLRQRGALTAAAAEALASARGIAAMEDLAAPYLPVVASRATVARGLGLQDLADAIRRGGEAPLSDLAGPFVKEGGEPGSLDAALGGARDILAEDLSLDAGLRRALQELFFREGVLKVSARPERRPAAGARPPGARAQALVGFEAPVAKVPPQKVLDIRRAERERAVLLTIEPPEERALEILHARTVPAEHPYAGLLRAAAEDGYRRILKPLLQDRVRAELKERADRQALEFFERSLRNVLLGPVGGRRRTLGLRPDVVQGHRWCAVDRDGLPTGSGQLPHGPTAGAEACIAELRDVLARYEIQVVALGTTGGRADALAIARAAIERLGADVEVVEVPDGGTRSLEAQGPLEVPERPVVPPEHRGALSLARRFQDPLAELVTIDPRALALGPHLGDVHQGLLRTVLDEVVESCVAHVGVDPNHAPAALLARVPGMDREKAEAFVAWRTQHGPLRAKAALAAVEGVGPRAAEEAVGFLRLGDAPDPRDRTQLHPEHYETVARMAESVGRGVEDLFADADVRRRVSFEGLAGDGTPLPLLKYVLYQATAGTEDPRPRHVRVIPPPPEVTLQTLFPGLVLQGRVVRVAPFGVFVDVGLGVDALLPVPHIGDRPGVEPATVAPLGAVIQARVLEVDPRKRRLTLTMRRDAGRPAGPPRRDGGGPRGAGPRGPRPRDGAPEVPREGPQPAGARGPQGGRPRFRADQGPDRRERRAERGPQGRPEGRPERRPERRPGRFEGGGGRFEGGRGPGGGPGRGARRFDDRDTPRRISLAADAPDLPPADEAALSPEELLRRKIEQMKRRLERGSAPEDEGGKRP